MPSVIYIHPNGSRQTLDVPAGQSVMQAAVSRGIEEILGECGGNAMCATCHVYVEPDQLDRLPPMGDDEDALLDGAAADRLPNSRLSCQIKVTGELDGLVVRLPDRQV
ncbi:2Fe-2S iron-sulfur cluster-binding protein [Enterovirga aerilata]|uniref:2Fe-2S iron-sulfur cluster binding domain-containing protein n=1 Tax=Enterovirga aerilata TaxID=2730920 RepID=A0A849HWA6_9HYPH|nr:2Fe-2S iron-sulfur cluster binding domain-containing protein [Enterovirga sp. DB1703]